MMHAQRQITIWLAILLSIAAVHTPARADNGPWRDGSDGARGPLAIDKLVIGHEPNGSATLEVVFEGPVSPSALGDKDFFIIDLDGTGDGKSDKWLVFGAPDGRWKSRSYNPSTKRVSRGGHYFEVRSPRSIWVYLAPDLLPGPDEGHLFAAVSYVGSTPGCASGCWDMVPNDGGWLVHDWTRPTVQRLRVDRFASGATPTAEVTWKVSDGGFANRVTSTLWWRIEGERTWRKRRTSRSRSLQSETIEMAEGQVAELKVTARDSTGNRAIAARTSTVAPYDDRAAAGSPEYVGLWSQAQREDAFLGSIQVSTSPLDTFAFSGEGDYYCLDYVSGAEFGIARVQLDDQVVLIDQSVEPEPFQDPYCFFADVTGTHTVSVSVESGRINVDGFWFR